MIQSLPPPPPEAAIVVTAQRLPDPAAERAFAIDRIDAARLHNSPSTGLDQILKEVPGLQLFRRSDARSGHPTSQGVTLRALGGNASSRALLILDGVPQSDPFGGWVNWPAYDPATVHEVLVVRGGGTVAHGPGALAGSIEMVSSLTAGIGASVDVGSRESIEARANIGTALGGGLLSLSGRAARGDGFVPITAGTRGPADQRAPYREANVRAQWVTPLSPSTQLQASLSGFHDQRTRGVAFTGNRTDGADASLRLVGTGRWPWSALAYAQWRELKSSFASVDAARAAATRVSLQDAVPSRGFGASVELRPPISREVELRIGADSRFTSGESRELFTYVAGEPTRRRRAGGVTLTAGLFSEAALDLGSLTLSGGARIDHWQIDHGKLIESQIATGASLRDEHYSSRSGWLPTARAGALLEAGGGFSLRSAAYLGWRLPTLNELFRPFRAGADATAANPMLDPEKLAGIEAGAGFARHGVTFAVTAFANRLTGAIANVTLGHGPGVFPGVGFVSASGEFRQRQNLHAIRVRGVEASGEARRGPWSARLGYSFADARVEADGPAAPLNGLRPAQTPRHMLTAGLGWDASGRSVSLVLRRVGGQFEDDLNQRLLPAATTIDAFGAWPVTRDLQLVVRAENLFDARVVAGIDGDGAIERATPRTLWIGLRFNRSQQPPAR
jgi:outer membrane receptor protein involved in Fe transport